VNFCLTLVEPGLFGSTLTFPLFWGVHDTWAGGVGNVTKIADFDLSPSIAFGCLLEFLFGGN